MQKLKAAFYHGDDALQIEADADGVRLDVNGDAFHVGPVVFAHVLRILRTASGVYLDNSGAGGAIGGAGRGSVYITAGTTRPAGVFWLRSYEADALAAFFEAAERRERLTA